MHLHGLPHLGQGGLDLGAAHQAQPGLPRPHVLQERAGFDDAGLRQDRQSQTDLDLAAGAGQDRESPLAGGGRGGDEGIDDQRGQPLTGSPRPRDLPKTPWASPLTWTRLKGLPFQRRDYLDAASAGRTTSGVTLPQRQRATG